MSFLGEYDRISVLRVLRAEEEATHADVEVLISALARANEGRKELSSDEARKAFTLAHEAIQGDLDGLGPLLLALRVIREARPPWFAAPLYAEILEPFTETCKTLFGETPAELFQIAVKIGDLRGESIKLAETFPPPLIEALWIELEKVSGPADLRDKVWIKFNDDWSYGLAYNVADALYRTLVRRLREILPSFGPRKGQSLEQFTQRRLRKLAPAWSFTSGTDLQGKEKDLLAWDDDSAVAVECKRLRIRGTSSDWSLLNLESDVQEVKLALEQLHPSIALLERGGSLDDGRKIGAHQLVQGLVVTDEPYTAFVRAGLDRLHLDDSDSEWHGKNVWVGSFLDLDYLVSVSGTMSVFLHYLQAYRNNAEVRGMDEPEAWSAYGAASTHAMRKVGALTIIKEHDWSKSRKNGVESFAPMWLRRLDAARTFDLRRSSAKGMRIVAQDLANAERAFRNDLAQHPRDPIEPDAIETVSNLIRDLEDERATRPKHPYRSL